MMFEMFKAASVSIAEATFSTIHAQYGINPAHHELLTQPEPWNQDQASQVRGILSDYVNISCTIAGIPADPLPGHYVAALIARVVAPANWLVAATRAPDTFDALAASGIEGRTEVRPFSRQQMISLVMLYAGGYNLEVVKTAPSKLAPVK